MYDEIFILLVLCLSEVIVIVNSLSGDGTLRKTKSQIPSRRFYLYNPEIIPNAAAALGMVIPQTFYNPMHYSSYDGEIEKEEEEEGDVEKHEDKFPTPIQLFTVVKKKYQKKKKVKKKKGRKKIKKVKKPFKKCIPFKFSIIKKSDINRNAPFYRNIRKQMPQNFRNEYFLGNSKLQNLTSISFNGSSVFSNGSGYSKVKFPTRKKIYKHLKPPRKYLIKRYNRTWKKPWSRPSSWRLAPPGRPVSEFILKETIPSATGGSPPPSPLFNVYQDNRIPLINNGESQKALEHTEPYEYEGFVPNYVHLHSSTPSYVAKEPLAEEYWKKFTTRKPSTASVDDYTDKYSDHDYYRYGTYTQNNGQNKNQQHALFFRDNMNNQKFAKSNGVNQNYYYQSFDSSSEKVITVTPASLWVPIPQSYNVISKQTYHGTDSQSSNGINIYDAQQHKHVGDGFRNFSSTYENTTRFGNFGDKIIFPKNCSLYFNSSIKAWNDSECQLQIGALENKVKRKIRKDVVNRKGSYKFYNRKTENKIPTETTTNNYFTEMLLNDAASDYGKLNLQTKRKNAEYIQKSSFKNVFKSESRGYRRSAKIKQTNLGENVKPTVDIVTAKYPEDDINEVHVSLIKSNPPRASRSNHGSFNAVVSSSLLVEEI